MLLPNSWLHRLPSNIERICVFIETNPGKRDSMDEQANELGQDTVGDRRIRQ
jgi:hypothetical protein